MRAAASFTIRELIMSRFVTTEKLNSCRYARCIHIVWSLAKAIPLSVKETEKIKRQVREVRVWPDLILIR